MKKYTPLIFAEVYLLTTLVVFFLGPIEFKIHNKELFIFTIFLYHAFLFLDILQIQQQKIHKKYYSTFFRKNNFISFYFSGFSLH